MQDPARKRRIGFMPANPIYCETMKAIDVIRTAEKLKGVKDHEAVMSLCKHFNVDKKTGNYMTLETLFGEDPDYITPLSEEVIRQMRGQMDEDPDLQYWIDSDEGPDYDFREISPAQDFYFDRDGNLVLCFNEGEAGPTYMGTVEFTIPSEITRQLLNR